ncbi:MAG TPA: alkaline phosphatase D family protein [Solirubrobacterales bacterium]|nr:alkaline phosphatase D family protein [Solirubrobacterales bacterium]
MPDEESDPKLVLGPLLRYVGATEATVWVEADRPCEVEVLGRREPTFTVEERHYALVRIEGLEPASFNEYEVSLDGERRWPAAGSELPPSAIRTLDSGKPIDVCFGSCRVALPHEEPYTHSKDRHEDGKEFDALRVLAREMTRTERHEWPEMLFLLGDQVYVDEGSPRTREKIHQRRGTETPPGEEVTDYEEYSWLYEEAWSDPLIRWLFSTVSVSMQWDDHDMSDDWNISRSWLEEMRRKSWWHRRATAGVMSYWVYQHLGNVSPRALDQDELYRQVRGNSRATAALREFAAKAHTTGDGTRWSFCRDLGGTRVIFVDSRAGRVLEEGERTIVDGDEWDWIVEHASGDFDHLLIATTVPWLLSPGFHHLEAWNERVCDGAWGGLAARAGEKLRRALDFDHWASFQRSFQGLRELLEEVGSGKRGRAPASIVVLSGDVHHAYLAETAFEPDTKMQSAVYQAVCSPYRNPLDNHERRAIRAGFSRPFVAAMRALAGTAGVADPGLRWRLAEGPYFDNQVASIRLDGREATLQLDKTIPGDEDERRLDCVFERRLA